MKILVDGNMPYTRDLSSRLGEMITVPGRPIPIVQLADVGAFMVRSVTKVNESLLVGRPVKFVGTATVGANHVDEAWLRQAGIGFSATPDCNAITVVEYVSSSLLMFVKRDGFSLHECTVGIVDVGNVGRRLQVQLGALGIKALFHDPPRADREGEGDFRSLGELVQHTDILISHTSLFKDGSYRTLHLTDEKPIRSLKPGVVLINACRGAVVDNTALPTHLNRGQKLSIVLDVWEGEPGLNVELLRKVNIGTPHIAGYTLEDKACSTTQVLEVYSKFIEHEQHIALNTLLSTPEFGRITLYSPLDQPALKRLMHLVYDVRRDDAPLHKVVGISDEFDKLRKNYFERHGWSSPYAVCDDVSAALLPCKLGLNAAHHPAR